MESRKTPELCLSSLLMCLNCENEKGAGGGGGGGGEGRGGGGGRRGGVLVVKVISDVYNKSRVDTNSHYVVL